MTTSHEGEWAREGHTACSAHTRSTYMYIATALCSSRTRQKRPPRRFRITKTGGRVTKKRPANKVTAPGGDLRLILVTEPPTSPTTRIRRFQQSKQRMLFSATLASLLPFTAGPSASSSLSHLSLSHIITYRSARATSARLHIPHRHIPRRI